MAEKLGMTLRPIMHWRVVPPDLVIQVERVTAVPRFQLRPDVFGEAGDIPLGSRALALALNVPWDEFVTWEETPAEYVLQVERLTNVSRHLLRPDVFGPEPQERRRSKMAMGSPALARSLGVGKEECRSWGMVPPAEYVLQIERLTGISRHELRPDVFGQAPDNEEEEEREEERAA